MKLRLCLALLVLLLPAVLTAADSPYQALSIEKIVQSIIDLPGLQPYLHPEVSGRVPLILLQGLVASETKLTKFDQPVLILPRKEIGERPFLELTRFEFKGESILIDFTYAVEGVVGNLVFVYKDKVWQLDSCKMAEQKK